MALTIDDTSYALPVDDTVAQKVASYNDALNAIQSAWASWTPSWTNLSVGNGTVTAKYRQIGKLVTCRLKIVFGSTTSISGDVDFSLPVTRATYPSVAGITNIGLLSMYDSSATTTYTGVLNTPTTTTSKLRAFSVSGSYIVVAVLSSTVPFTWTTSDEIAATFSYEAA